MSEILIRSIAELLGIACFLYFSYRSFRPDSPVQFQNIWESMFPVPDRLQQQARGVSRIFGFVHLAVAVFIGMLLLLDIITIIQLLVNR